MRKNIIIVTILAFSVLLGTPSIAKAPNSAAKNVDRYAEIAKNIEIFMSVYRKVNSLYVDEIDPNIIMKNAIDGMLENLDPYTEYISSADMDDFQLQTTGRYGGIGAVITEDKGQVIIRQPYEGSPSQKVGLRAGDRIIEVDGLNATDKGSEDIRQLLRGQPNTEVSVKVIRAVSEDTLSFTFNREEINLGNVPYYGMLENQIAYVKLDQFTKGAAANVEKALKELKSQNEVKAIVLDLRNNPGGLLHEAVALSNLFIDKGKLVTATKGKIEEANREYNTKNKAFDTQTPLAVMINQGSASASEIVSGVIQDYDRGVVVGQTTFGKGLVQITQDLPYKSKLKVTTYKYYIPSGRCIQAIDYSSQGKSTTPDSLRQVFYTEANRPVKDGAGIEPDIIIENEEYAPITISLYTKDMFFKYAHEYRHRNPNISSTGVFSLSEEEYKDFLSFIEDKKYDYTTKTERMLDDLINVAKNESYYDGISDALDVLDKNIRHDKKQDVIKHQDEIKALLEKEIAGRYKYQKGEIEVSLKYDKELEKAIEVLQSEEYKTILTAAK